MVLKRKTKHCFVLCLLSIVILLLARQLMSNEQVAVFKFMSSLTAVEKNALAKDKPAEITHNEQVNFTNDKLVKFTKDKPVNISNYKQVTYMYSNKDNEPAKLRTEVITSGEVECPCPSDLTEAKAKDVAMEMETNEDVVISMFQRSGLKARKGLGRRREALDPVFEVPLMRYAPPRHALCLPDHTRSKVFLLTPSDHLSVGSTVRFRVDLYNGCGRPRFTGGDEIRAWLKSQDGKSSVAAKVMDLQNGSYVGETVLPWSGVTLVRVSLTYAQEYLRLSVGLYHTLHSMRYTTETLKSGSIQETVPCLSSPPVPGYASTCNFTAANGGLPWYCGRPQDSRLDCSHRGTYSNLPYTWPLSIPSPLQRYVKDLHNCCEGKNINLRLIPNTIRLQASADKTPRPGPLPPCYSRPVQESWVSQSPRGWLHHGQWISSMCTLPAFTKDRVRRCLRNTTLLLLGDSNQRLLWETILDKLGCTTRIQHAWNAPHLCKNDVLQTLLMFVTHAFPFRPGTHGGTPVTNVPLPMALTEIEKLDHPDHNKKVIVVIHYYLHPSTEPVQVFRSFVQAARKTVQEYLKVHPDVKFLIRGPHVMYQGNNNHANIGDKFAPWYVRLWKEEFAELTDRVWYLDIWDLTIASENPTSHPVPIVSEIAKILFGYMCGDE